MTHTPGPWYWDINRRARTIRLWGGNRLVVMDFVRWGMQSAQPRFSNRPNEKHGGIMYTADEYDKGQVAGFASVGSHPDARLIAAAPDLLEALKLCLRFVRDDVYEMDGGSNCFFCGAEIDSGDEHKDDCVQLVAYLAAKSAIEKAEASGRKSNERTTDFIQR